MIHDDFSTDDDLHRALGELNSLYGKGDPKVVVLAPSSNTGVLHGVLITKRPYGLGCSNFSVDVRPGSFVVHALRGKRTVKSDYFD